MRVKMVTFTKVQQTDFLIGSLIGIWYKESPRTNETEITDRKTVLQCLIWTANDCPMYHIVRFKLQEKYTTNELNCFCF